MFPRHPTALWMIVWDFRLCRPSLVSKRRRVQGWALARDLVIAGAGALFSMWVTLAAGYQAVYQALVVVLAGVVVYAFLKAQRERAGEVAAPADNPPLVPAPGTGR